MSHHTLMREAAKVGVGLVLADIASVFWFQAAGFFPLTVLGVTWTSAAIVPILVFDLALLILLAHYAWHMKLPVESPSQRTLFLTVGTVFLLVGLAHLGRIALDLDLVLGEFALPMWLSWFGVVLTGYLSYASFHFALRKRR